MRTVIAIIDEAAHKSQKKWNASLVLFPVCGRQRFEMGWGSANLGAFKALLLAVLECPVCVEVLEVLTDNLLLFDIWNGYRMLRADHLVETRDEIEREILKRRRLWGRFEVLVKKKSRELIAPAHKTLEVRIKEFWEEKYGEDLFRRKKGGEDAKGATT